MKKIHCRYWAKLIFRGKWTMNSFHVMSKLTVSRTTQVIISGRHKWWFDLKWFYLARVMRIIESLSHGEFCTRRKTSIDDSALNTKLLKAPRHRVNVLNEISTLFLFKKSSIFQNYCFCHKCLYIWKLSSIISSK